MKFNHAITISVLSFALLPLAIQAKTPYFGVWAGTLGNHPIRVCFNQDSDSYSASYYYQRYLTPIALSLAKNGSWTEQNNTGQWHIAYDGNSQLSGTWSLISGQKTLPLTLKRISSSPQACGDDTYVLPLEKHFHLKKGKWTTAAGIRYRELSYAGNALEFADDFPAAKTLNKQLISTISSTTAVAGFNAMRRRSLALFGHIETNEESVTPIFKSDSLIGLNFYFWAAGTGARGINSVDRYFRVDTGQPINPWRWFIPLKDPDRYEAQLPASLLKKYPLSFDPQSECGAPDGTGWYRIRLTPNGITFWDWPTGDGCESELSLTYQQALPFTNKAGKHYLNQLMHSVITH